MALIKRNGVWWLRKKIEGRRYRLSTKVPVATQKTKDKALLVAAELETEIRTGTRSHKKKNAPTLGAWWNTYEQTYSAQKSDPERDRQVMAHALPFFKAETPLDQVKKTDCLRYLNTRRQASQAGLKRKSPGQIAEGTVQRERSFLQALWQQAIEDGYEITNPWRGIERKPYSVRDRLLTEAEQVRLLSGLSSRFQRFVLFLLGTGVRLDECRGIDPRRDIDLTRRFITVTGKFGKTRTVPISAELVPLVQSQLAEDGKLWTQVPCVLRAVIARGAKRAGIDHLGPHTLRHTFGWRYLKGGGDIYKLSRILGHASVATTQRHYAHLLREDLRDALDVVDLGIRASVKAVVKIAEQERGAGKVLPFETV